MPRKGLPSAVKMRHDQHYVEALAASAGAPLGRMVPIDRVDPNPDQPRQVMGDLSELMASISEKGILEPLIVRQRRGRFQIVAGERRYQAAVQLALAEVPAVIREVGDEEMIEIALIENLQRKDISPFEEAEALHTLVQEQGLKHDDVARRIGKSRSSVTESLALHAMPEEVRELCRLADITSKSLLLQVVRQGDAQKMVAFVEQLTRGAGPATREQARAVAARQSEQRKPGRPKAFVFKYVPPAKSFNLNLKFRKSQVEREEIISALTEIIEELKQTG